MKRYPIVLLIAACGGGSDAPAVDALVSVCGHPGDIGNDVGVGKFCNTISDCNGNQHALLCSSLGDSTTHFCTQTCQMGSTDMCGADAMCVCQSGGSTCGCTPNVCLSN